MKWNHIFLILQWCIRRILVVNCLCCDPSGASQRSGHVWKKKMCRQGDIFIFQTSWIFFPLKDIKYIRRNLLHFLSKTIQVLKGNVCQLSLSVGSKPLRRRLCPHLSMLCPSTWSRTWHAVGALEISVECSFVASWAYALIQVTFFFSGQYHEQWLSLSS